LCVQEAGERVVKFSGQEAERFVLLAKTA
jgi:hypothetical protein